MAIKYMTTVDPYSIQKDYRDWEYDTGDLASAGNGDTIIIPNGVNIINVVLEITAGSGKIQTTCNKLADVISDTDVVWLDWPFGTISATAQDSFDGRVTAVRMVNATGTTRLMICAT